MVVVNAAGAGRGLYLRLQVWVAKAVRLWLELIGTDASRSTGVPCNTSVIIVLIILAHFAASSAACSYSGVVSVPDQIVFKDAVDHLIIVDFGTTGDCSSY